jgi:hypothetical protein
MGELELIIQFQLTITQLAAKEKRAEFKYLFRFLKQKKAELYCMGINV